MKQSRNFLTVIFFTFFTLSAFTQSNKINVEGAVTDTLGQPLLGATVILLQQEDSVLAAFGITDTDGRFLMKKMLPNNYILQVTYVGYANYSQNLTVPAEGTIFEVPKVQLQTASANLDEVVVKAEHIPIMMKKDTLEYNAAAFKTQPGSVVEDLLKKLPGVEVDRNGNIRAQGQDVQNILVDGKEFFGNDPKIATKNLPADAIDKVQVFDRKSDIEDFTGIDDGRRNQAINLKLKDGKKAGYFGNVSSGYGKPSDNNVSDRYSGKFNINRFTKKMQLSAIGMANNINEQGFSINDYINFMGGLQNMMSGGGGRMSLSLNTNDLGMPLGEGGLQNGFVDSWAGGINFNYDLGKKTDLQSSYFYSRLENDIERDVFRQNLSEAGGFTSKDKTAQLNRSTNHRINFNLRHEIDSFQNLIFRGNVGFNDGFSNSIGSSETLDVEDVLTNDGTRDYRSEGENFNFNGGLTYRRRFNRIGRAFVANASFGMRDDKQKASLNSSLNFHQEDSTTIIDQRQTRTDDQLNYAARLSYIEPLGNRKYLEISYSHQNYANELAKEVFDIDPTSDPEETRNTQLSNHYDRNYTYDRGGLNLRVVRKKFNLTTGLSLQHSALDGKIISEGEDIKKSFTNVLPSLRWNWELALSRNLEFEYQTSVREPSIEQLQPIIDNSDPLNLYIGNPELRPEYSHNFRLNFMNYDQFSFTNIFITLDARYTENSITNERHIDNVTLQQTLRPVNVKDNLLLNGYFDFGTPLKFMKSRINFNYNVSYNRGILFVNNFENITDRLTSTVDLSLENRKKDILDLAIGANWNYNSTKYSETESLDQDFITQTYYADATANIGKNWSLSSSLDYTIYPAESFGSRSEIPIWHASLTRYFLKNRKGRLELSAFDLLNKNVGVNRTSQLNYIEESRIRSLARYVMLKFSYSLSGFGENGSSGGIEFRGSGRRR